MRKSLCLLLSVAVVATAALSLQPFSTSSLEAAARTRKPAIPKFQLQYFDIPGRGSLMYAQDINSLGQVVGYYDDGAGDQRGFLYDAEISATTALDLEAMIGSAGVPEGWHVTRATSINDFGVILGEMAGTDPETGDAVRWGFVLDTFSPSPTVIPLPEIPGVTEFSLLRPMQINNDGDILCQYKANGAYWIFAVNPFTQTGPWYLDQPVWGTFSNRIGNATSSHPAIVGVRLANGTLARWTPESDTLQPLGLYATFLGMNDAGHMAGSYNNLPMRLISPPPKTFNMGSQLLYTANGINNSDDVTIMGGYLYRDDVGLINLASYLSGTTADRALWTGALINSLGKITDRDAVTNYGQMTGTLTLRDASGATYYQPYLLTPVVTTGR